MFERELFRGRTTASASWLLSSMMFLASMGTGSLALASEVRVNTSANHVAENGASDGTGNTRSLTSGMVSENASSAFSGSGGTGAATAAFGVLKSSATAGASRGNIFNGFASIGKAYSSAQWSDAITVTGVGLSDTGWANVLLFVDSASGSVFNSGTAGLGGSFSGTAAADFVFAVNGTTLFSFDTQAALTHLGTDAASTFTRVNRLDYTGDLGRVWELAIPITFGQAFAVDASIVTTASTLAGSNSTANSLADFGHSIYWGGITSITLSDGSTTTAFSALGSTAHDWKASATPVPEPNGAWLLCVGLAMLALHPAVRKRFRPRSLHPRTH